MNKKEYQLSPVASRIYMFAFQYSKPVRKYQLVKEMNSKLESRITDHAVTDRIFKDKLVEKGYFDFFQEGKRNQWWIYAKSGPLIERIQNSDVGSILNEDDIKILKKILGSDAFRKLVTEDMQISSDPIEQILSYFDIWACIMKDLIPTIKKYYIMDEKNKKIYLKVNFNNYNEYCSYLDMMRPAFNNVKIRTAEYILSSMPVKQKEKAYRFFNNVEDLFNLLIPEKQLRKIGAGITPLGKFFQKRVLMKENINEGISKLNKLGSDDIKKILKRVEADNKKRKK